MKKLLTILSLLITAICYSQTRPIQPLGTKANEVKVLGALSIDTALFVTSYATLAAADVPGQYARTRGGSLIFVRNENALYLRNDAATAWLKIALGSSAYTLLSQFVSEPAWQMYYSNGSGDVTAFPFAASGVLTSNGINAPPTWQAAADASATNEIQTYAHTGTTSYTNTLSLGGGAFTLQAAGINTISHSAGTVTITATEVDGSNTNELQILANTSNSTNYIVTLNQGGGSFELREGSGILLTTTGTAANGITTIDAADASATNELQTLANTSDATSHTVTLSSTGGSIKFIEGSNITITTTGTGLDGVVTIAASGAAAFTAEDAQDAIGLMINASLQYVDATPLLAIGDRDFGDITTTGSGLTMTIDANAVSFAKFVQGAANTVVTNPTTGTANFTTTALAANNLLGRGSTGNIAPITVAGTLSFSGTVLTGTGITSEVDGSITNELQTYAHTGTTSYTNTLSQSGGAFTLQSSGIVTIAHTTGTVTISATEVDGSITNEIQTISNTSAATTHTVTLSNSGGTFVIEEGANITLTTVGNTVTIASTASGGGAITLAPIGAVPNANAATLTGTVLNLEPASVSFGGVVTTIAQSFAGNKIFTGGLESIVVDNSNFRGGYASLSGTSTGVNNVSIGHRAGMNGDITNSVYLGFYAGAYAQSSGNVGIGTFAGRGGGGANLGGENVAIGLFSMYNANGAGVAGNIAIGSYALGSTVSGGNIAIGGYAGQTGGGGGNNVYIGNAAGLSVSSGTGHNVYIGTEAGRSGTSNSYNVFIGDNAGYFETGDNKLYIANTYTGTPLLYGEFNNSFLRVNGTFQVLTTAQNVATFTSNSGSTGGIRIDGSIGNAFLSYGLYGVEKFTATVGDLLVTDGTADYQIRNMQDNWTPLSIDGASNYVSIGAKLWGLGNGHIPLRRLDVYERWIQDYTSIPAMRVTAGATNNGAIGNGTGYEIALANASPYDSKAAAYLEASWVAVAGGLHSADFIVNLMQGGATYAEKMRVLSTGELKVQLLNNDDAESKVVVWNSTDKIFEWRAASTLTGTGGGGYTNMTQFLTQTPYRMFYSDASGDVQELPHGTSGQILTSGGASANPSWTTVSSVGEANTASNLGAGVNVYSTKVGVDLRFNTFNAADFAAVGNVIGISYATAQAANGTLKGFLTAADWTSFNNKWSLAGNTLTATGIIGSLNNFDVEYKRNNLTYFKTMQWAASNLNKGLNYPMISDYNNDPQAPDNSYYFSVGAYIGNPMTEEIIDGSSIRMGTLPFYGNKDHVFMFRPTTTPDRIDDYAVIEAQRYKGLRIGTFQAEGSTAGAGFGSVGIDIDRVNLVLFTATINSFERRINYTGNIHGLFDPFSLVTKKYVDSIAALGGGGGNIIDNLQATIDAGSTLTSSETIDLGANILTLTSNGVNTGVLVTKTSGAGATFGAFNYGTGAAIIGDATGGGVGVSARVDNSTTNTLSPVLDITLMSYATSVAGIGSYIRWYNPSTASNATEAARLVVRRTDYTGSVYDDDYEFWSNRNSTMTKQGAFLSSGGLYVDALANDDTETKVVVWNSTAKIFEYRESSTLGGGGGGTIGGSIAANQVAYGSGANTITGNANFLYDGTNLRLGNTTSAGTATPPFFSSGATYGTGILGSSANLKWLLWDNGIAGDLYGIGMSAGFMDIHVGTGGGINFSVNAGTSLLTLTTAGVIQLGSVANDDTETKILTWNSTDKSVEWRLSSTLGGGSSGITINSTTITGGTSNNILFNNAGTVGEYGLSGGGGLVVMSNSPTINTPNISSITNTGTLTLPTVTGTLTQYAEVNITSNATWSPAGNARDNYYNVSLQAAAVTTINAPSGTPTNLNSLTIRVKSDGTARAIGGWNAIYRAGTNLAFPTTTTINKTMYIKFLHNSTDSKWDLVSVIDGL